MPSQSNDSPNLDELIENIRQQKEFRQTRAHEYYVDFDPRREGYVTKDIFKRYVEQQFGVDVSKTPRQEQVLYEVFADDPKKPSMVNYRRFNSAIDPQYDTRSFVDQSSVTGQSSSLPKTSFFATAQIGSAGKDRAHEAMLNMAKVYKTHEINLRACFQDFDTHNLGVVTKSQFLRAFPGAFNHTINEEEKLAIAEKYQHPTKKEQIKYMLWRTDMDKLVDSLRLDATAPPKLHKLPEMQKRELTVPDIVDKIRNTVYKEGIRTMEYFKDNDKLRCGNVTRPQFEQAIKGIMKSCDRQQQLTPCEVGKLADALTANSIGHVQYKDFCTDMEHAYSCPEMEKNPTLDLMRPPQGALYTCPNVLSEGEEEAVQKILDRLETEVKEKRISLHCYFKDFDHPDHYTSGITKTRFARELVKSKLTLKEEELDLVCRKYEVHENHGDIHYPHFCERIDEQFKRTADVTGSWNTTIYPTQ